MMNRFGLFIAAAFAATLAGGCAAPNGTQKAADDDKVYVTGSRIAVKESPHAGVKAMTDRRAIEDMMRPGGAATGGVLGAGGN